MKKLFNLSAALKVLVLMLSFSLVSCDNPWFDPDLGNGGGSKPPVIQDCNIFGTVEKVTCGVGYYGDLWIRTDKGELLQPCEQSFQTLVPIILSPGDKVKIGYRVLNKPNRCDSLITCLIALPPHQSVVIDCITKIEAGVPKLKINPNVTADNVNIERVELAGDILKVKVGYSGCSEKPNSHFSLFWDGKLDNRIQPEVNLFVEDDAPESCQAYFTTQLQFDIRELKNRFNGSLKINIGQYTLIY